MGAAMTASTNFADATTTKFDLNATTETLQLIADWRDDLLTSVARAQIQFELIGLDEDEQDLLKAEVADFRRVCAGLAWRNAA